MQAVTLRFVGAFFLELSMTSVIPFAFNALTVRAVLRDGEPWFVAQDVCKALTVENNRDAMARLDDDEKDVGIIDTLGGAQEMTIISESGLYSLVLTSRKPEAKRFKKWITSEVLPSIRKTGGYSTTQTPVVKDPQLAAMVLMLTKLDSVKQEQDAQRLELADIRAKITATPEQYYTVAGYASLRGLSIDTNRANLLGRKAAKISREHGIEICKAHSAIHGNVNSYHVDVLCDTFKTI